MEKKQLLITSELTIDGYIDAEFGILFTSDQVAKGFVVEEKTIRNHKSNHPDTLKENKHYTSRVVETAAGNRTATCWTLRGIMRLEAYVQTDSAAVFGGWAEALIFDGTEIDVLGREDLLRQQGDLQTKVDAQQIIVDALPDVIKLKELKKQQAEIQKRKKSIDAETISGMRNLWQQNLSPQ